MKMTIRNIIILITLFSVQEINAQTLHEKIDSLGQITLNESGTLGGYVSIIQSDSVIYSEAFGFNDKRAQSRLNDSTIFPISSNTKAFNSILLSQLVEKEELDFDKPLKTYLPKIEFKSEFITNNINLTDLLTHRWGIPRYDFTYYLLSNEEKKNANESVFNKLKFLEISTPFRTRFQYGNNQYIIAAYLLEELTGNKWEDQLNTQILIPLEMNDSHCELTGFIDCKNKSIGYQNKEEVDIMLGAPLYEVSGMGNIFSSIRDLEKWSKFLMNGNDLILTKEFINYNLHSHFNIGYEEPYQGFSNMEYGFGWFIFDYYGHKVVLHHGDNVGHQSLIVLLPDDNLSWVIMANEGMKSYGFPFTMTYFLLDLFLDEEEKDWNTILPNNSAFNLKYPDSLIVQNKIPTLKLKKYAGEYSNDGFGLLEFYMLDGKLIIHAGAYTDELTHLKNNSFRAVSEEFKEDYIFTFEVNEDDEVVSVKTDLIEPTIDLIEFKKRL